jgi:imidazolonepropionase
MPAMLVSNIKLLVNTREQNHLLRGRDLAHLPCIQDAYMVIDRGRIAEVGKMTDCRHRPEDSCMR